MTQVSRRTAIQAGAALGLGLAGLGRDAPLFAAALLMLPCIAIMRGLRSRAAGVQSAD